ncbi:MAG: TetR family transcriptional regulator [Acidimicrobiales bacterium]
MSADASTAENGDADRRRPQQQRSRAKVDALLDATDDLLAAEGAAAVTTTAVTERAGVAVETLYQYFAGVDALLGAVGERHASTSGIAQRSLRDRRLTRKRDAANLALDTLIEYARETPAFRALWSAPSVRRDAGQGVSSAAEPLVQLVATALVDQGLGEADDPGFDLEVQIQWAVAEGLIRLAFDRDPGGDPVVLAHLRRLWDLDVELG